MNESEIAFNGSDTCGDQCVTVLKFANFCFAEQKPSDLKENRKGNGDSKKKNFKVEMKKIIGDHVDFDKEGEKYKARESFKEMKNKKKKNAKKSKNRKK